MSDRNAIRDIISEMLSNPDASGIYPTSTAMTKLEWYVMQQRFLAAGWTWAQACTLLDKCHDPRCYDQRKIVDGLIKAFGKEAESSI